MPKPDEITINLITDRNKGSTAGKCERTQNHCRLFFFLFKEAVVHFVANTGSEG